MDHTTLIIVLPLVTFALVGAWMYLSKREAEEGIKRRG